MAKVIDRTTTGEPIKNLNVNGNWFQRHKKGLKIVVAGIAVLGVILLHSCHDDRDSEMKPCGPDVTDKIIDEDTKTDEEQSTQEQENTETEEDERETSHTSIITDKNQQTNGQTSGSTNTGGSINHGGGNTGGDSNHGGGSTGGEEKPEQKPDSKPDPTPKPDPEPTPDPKPDPKPEKPAEYDRKPITDDEDRQPNISGNEGDFVLEAYEEDTSYGLESEAKTLYREDVPAVEEETMTNYSIRIEYLKELKASFEEQVTEQNVEEVSVTR